MTYLKPKEYYEERYDTETVAVCREGEEVVNTAFSKLEKKLSPEEFIAERLTAWYLEYSQLYFQLVELPAFIRSKAREEVIVALMKQDQDKDERLAAAKLPKQPYCLECGKDMVQFSKVYGHREDSKDPDKDDILFMLKCPTCNSRIALWHDGTEWEGAKTLCQKCGSAMSSSHKETKTALTTTYLCPNCKHSYTDTYKFKRKPAPEPVDPYYELDHKRFCFDADMDEKCQARLEHLNRYYRLKAFENSQGKTQETAIHDAVQAIKKIKIAQLPDILDAPLAKAQYTKLHFDQPELGVDVIVPFSCLDAQAERDEYKSKTELKKLIIKALEPTNWRLTSEGLRYRVGYLTGRLRAYEKEADLRKLAGLDDPRLQSDDAADPSKPFPGYVDAYTPEVNIHLETIKVLSGTLRLHSEDVPGDNKRPDYLLSFTGTLLPENRVLIPARAHDESVPQFIRNYDFTIQGTPSLHSRGPKRKDAKEDGKTDTPKAKTK